MAPPPELIVEDPEIEMNPGPTMAGKLLSTAMITGPFVEDMPAVPFRKKSTPVNILICPVALTRLIGIRTFGVKFVLPPAKVYIVLPMIG